MSACVVLGLISGRGFLKFGAEDNLGCLLKGGVKKKEWEGKKGREVKKTRKMRT